MSEHGKQGNAHRWLSRALWVIALAGLAYLVGLTAWLGVTGLLFPFQLDYGEGVILHFVQEWAAGRPIYLPVGEYPFITCNYAPLHLLLALAASPLLGLTYAAGRVWTLVAVVGTAGIIAAWVKVEGRHWLPAVTAAMLFLGSPYV